MSTEYIKSVHKYSSVPQKDAEDEMESVDGSAQFIEMQTWSGTQKWL